MSFKWRGPISIKPSTRQGSLSWILPPVGVLLIAGLCAAHPGRGVDPPRVGMLVRGRLVVQPVTGGIAAPAAEAQKAAWRRVPRSYSLISPDDTYRVERVEVPEDVTEGIRVLGPDNREVVSLRQLMRATGAEDEAMVHLSFQGWLPDSRHFAVNRHYHIAGMDTDDRCVVTVPGGRPIAFAGWAGRSTGYVITPLKERRVHQSNERSDNGKPALSRVALASVRLPQHLEEFHLRQVAKKTLTWKGKPFYLPLDQFVAFSPDGAWALANLQYSDAGSYLISLKAGTVQRLPGSQAAFLTDADDTSSH